MYRCTSGNAGAYQGYVELLGDDRGAHGELLGVTGCVPMTGAKILGPSPPQGLQTPTANPVLAAAPFKRREARFWTPEPASSSSMPELGL